MTCNVQLLMNDAAGFASLNPGQLEIVKTALLCQILKASNPVASCDVQTLMNDAACFACLPLGTLQVIQTQLLCNIVAAGGGGGGGSGSLTGLGSPEGVVAGNIGQHYWDQTNREDYIKTSNSGGNTGWEPFLGI